MTCIHCGDEVEPATEPAHGAPWQHTATTAIHCDPFAGWLACTADLANPGCRCQLRRVPPPVAVRDLEQLDFYGCDGCQLTPDYVGPEGERCACAAGQGADRSQCRCPGGRWGLAVESGTPPGTAP